PALSQTPTPSLHDALPISISSHICWVGITPASVSLLALPSTMTLMFYPHLCLRWLPFLLGKPIRRALTLWSNGPARNRHPEQNRSEEHTSELQSRFDLVCR